MYFHIDFIGITEVWRYRSVAELATLYLIKSIKMCNVMIVDENLSTIHSFYVVINSAIVVNSLRVPMIISFAFKENNSTVCRSRGQKWIHRKLFDAFYTKSTY